ncbi:MAG: ECF transporter S component, partial [Candidatus Eremiobacterota bacterium]
MREETRLSRLLKVGLLSSLATALMVTVQVPFPGAPFLKYDPSEVAALIGGFALGPMYGLAILVVKNLLFLLLRFDVQ